MYEAHTDSLNIGIDKKIKSNKKLALNQRHILNGKKQNAFIRHNIYTIHSQTNSTL